MARAWLNEMDRIILSNTLEKLGPFSIDKKDGSYWVIWSKSGKKTMHNSLVEARAAACGRILNHALENCSNWEFAINTGNIRTKLVDKFIKEFIACNGNMTIHHTFANRNRYILTMLEQ